VSELDWIKEALVQSELGVWELSLPSGGMRFEGTLWPELAGRSRARLATLADYQAIIHPDDAAETGASLRQAIEGRVQHYQTRFRVRSPDGSWRWLEGNGSVVARDERGIATRVVGSVRDCDARQRAEAELRESEERFRSFIAHSRDAVWCLEPDEPIPLDMPKTSSSHVCSSPGSRRATTPTRGRAAPRRRP
jgi:PAS domain S-box-containing protein